MVATRVATQFLEALAARPVGIRRRGECEASPLLGGGEVPLDPVERVRACQRMRAARDGSMNCWMETYCSHSRQLADDLPAKPDEEAGEDERGDPGGELEESFWDAQALEHGRSIFAGRGSQPMDAGGCPYDTDADTDRGRRPDIKLRRQAPPKTRVLLKF